MMFRGSSLWSRGQVQAGYTLYCIYARELWCVKYQVGRRLLNSLCLVAEVCQCGKKHVLRLAPDDWLVFMASGYTYWSSAFWQRYNNVNCELMGQVGNSHQFSEATNSPLQSPNGRQIGDCVRVYKISARVRLWIAWSLDTILESVQRAVRGSHQWDFLCRIVLTLRCCDIHMHQWADLTLCAITANG